MVRFYSRIHEQVNTCGMAIGRSITPAHHLSIPPGAFAVDDLEGAGLSERRLHVNSFDRSAPLCRYYFPKNRAQLMDL